MDIFDRNRLHKQADELGTYLANSLWGTYREFVREVVALNGGDAMDSLSDFIHDAAFDRIGLDAFREDGTIWPFVESRATEHFMEQARKLVNRNRANVAYMMDHVY